MYKELLLKAEEVYNQNFPNEATFERAVFFSWGCVIGDCAFCYMSTQPKDKKPKETKRSMESIFAEFILAKELKWDIGFFTGGIGVFTPHEIEIMLKVIYNIIGEKIWLSVGPTSADLLTHYAPYIKGVVGSIETINPQLHKKVCPSKPIEPYEKMFLEAKKIGLQRAMTFIVGMGETKEDIKLLIKFIEKYEINKIHIYGLIPEKKTIFENYPVPSVEEQAWWIAQLRIHFPKLDIQAGIWDDRLERISPLLKAGANSLSKFQALKFFGTKTAIELEHQVALSGRKFKSNLTVLPKTDWKKEVEKLEVPAEMKTKILEKLMRYVTQMEKNITKNRDNKIIITLLPNHYLLEELV
ncbi:radical SAM protein [Candidatus Woesearchaeota archaeon]|nr:radical SAM protein [Candidatus Woesearchaeota archaeon]